MYCQLYTDWYMSCKKIRESEYIVSWEPEGHYHYSTKFLWEPEGRYHFPTKLTWEPQGRYRCTKCLAIAPFWWWMEHCGTPLTPFWFSADNIALKIWRHIWIDFVHGDKMVPNDIIGNNDNSPFIYMFSAFPALDAAQSTWITTLAWAPAASSLALEHLRKNPTKYLFRLCLSHFSLQFAHVTLVNEK